LSNIDYMSLMHFFVKELEVVVVDASMTLYLRQQKTIWCIIPN